MQMNDMHRKKREERKIHTQQECGEKFTCLLWYLMKHEAGHAPAAGR